MNLFLHLDKSIYQPQETIWFTGYILNRDEELMRAQNTLYVVLVDPVNKSVVLKQRFLIQSGFGKGFLTLPDTIAAGDYWFLGYTNALLQTGDEPLFRQLISVRTGEPSPFRIISENLEPGTDSLRLRYKIGTNYGGLAAGGKFSYTLFDSTSAISKGVKLIDAFGEVVIPVASAQDSGKYRDLAVTITRGDLTKKILLPVYAGNPPSQIAPLPKEFTASTVDVKITPDAGYYRPRSIVTLNIRMQDKAGQPLPGIFSIAVASSKRLDSGRTHSIIQSDRQSDSWPLPAKVVQQLQNLAGDMPDYGYVLEDDNKVKRPVSLALMGNAFATFKTDSRGQFALPYNAMVTPVGGVNYLSVTERAPERFKIKIFSRADTFDKQLAAIHYPLPAAGPLARSEELTSQTSSIMLKAAVVKAQSQTEYNSLAGEYNSTHCDQDYVCTHRSERGNGETPDYFLNCPFLGRSGQCSLTKPIEGRRYKLAPTDALYRTQFGAKVVTYHCAAPSVPAFMKALDPILEAKKFPSPCNSKVDVLGSGLQSTVYWNHSVTTDNNGEITISFYTDDLTGDFTAFLQGVSSAGVIAGQSTFAVAKQDPTTIPTGISTAQSSSVGGGH